MSKYLRLGVGVREVHGRVGGRSQGAPALSLQPVWSHQAEGCQLAESEKKAGHDTPVVIPEPE